MHVVLISLTAPIGIKQDRFGARIFCYEVRHVIKLSSMYPKKLYKFVQFPLFARTLRSAMVIKSVVSVMADCDVVFYCVTG